MAHCRSYCSMSESGQDYQSRLPGRAPDRVPQPGPRRRARPQSQRTARGRASRAVQTRVRRKRRPLRGAAAIGEAVGAVLSGKKMAKHFIRTITADNFIFARNDATIAGEARFHGVYVLRTLVPTTHSIPKPRYAPMRPSPPSNALFAAARPSISRCASSTIGARIGSAPTSSGSCSPRLPPRMAPAPGTRPHPVQ